VSQALTAKSVILRILRDSQEAQFLGAFASVDKAPRIIIIKYVVDIGCRYRRSLAKVHSGGQLAGIILESFTKEQFTEQLLLCLGETDASNASTEQTESPIPEPPAAPIAYNSPLTNTSPAPVIHSQPPSAPVTQTSEPPTSPRDTPATTQPRESSPEREASRAQVRGWAETQRLRNLDARRDRDRVLALIEADKRARKQRQRVASPSSPMSTENSSDSIKSSNLTSSNASTANIQVRLPSGRSLRRTFPSSATPASDLRPWIDEELASDDAEAPAYRLKHIRGPPQPAREIAAGEEQESLLENSLVPSANIVIVPIPKSASAYPSTITGVASDLVWGALMLPGRAITGIAATVVDVVGGWNVNGTANDPNDNELDDEEEERRKEASEGTSTGRVRTMAQMRAERDNERTQLYNGNQVRFSSQYRACTNLDS
jgi:UBX domain